jgi:integrase
MRKHHPKNERIKRQYLDYLRHAKRLSSASVDQAAAAIAGFEAWSKYRDFSNFHIAQAKGYKEHLAQQLNTKTGKPLSTATIHSRLMAIKAFVFWLAGQPGYKSRISYADADYFNPSANDSRIATARREKRVPTLKQVKLVISKMPSGSDIEKRDRAILAFTLLTGARDNATASFKLKHVDLSQRKVFQDAREVRTKNRKTFDTFFFPVGDDIETIVTDWIAYLKTELLFGPDDPLFPKTRVGLDNKRQFAAAGLTREHWKNASAIRDIFKAAFEAADLPYANPHSLRDTLSHLGERLCQTPEAFKAWSQNLGHDRVMTTFTSYGKVPTRRQAQIIHAFSCKTGDEEADRPMTRSEVEAFIKSFGQTET